METNISITALAASSNGNSYYIKSGNTEILIDAGISAKCICDRLKTIGTDISNICGIFVTHEHIDHVKGLAVLSKKHPIPIHMTRPSAKEYRLIPIVADSGELQEKVGKVCADFFFCNTVF